MASANTFPHLVRAASLADLASVHVAEHDSGTLAWLEGKISGAGTGIGVTG